MPTSYTRRQTGMRSCKKMPCKTLFHATTHHSSNCHRGLWQWKTIKRPFLPKKNEIEKGMNYDVVGINQIDTIQQIRTERFLAIEITLRVTVASNRSCKKATISILDCSSSTLSPLPTLLRLSPRLRYESNTVFLNWRYISINLNSLYHPLTQPLWNAKI